MTRLWLYCLSDPPVSHAEMVCPALEKYSEQIGDYVFLEMKPGSNYIQEPGFFKKIYIYIFFNFIVFISKRYGLVLAYENLASLPAKIPALTSPLVPQLWLRNLPVCLH